MNIELSWRKVKTRREKYNWREEILSSDRALISPGKVILTVRPGAGVRLLSCKYQI